MSAVAAAVASGLLAGEGPSPFGHSIGHWSSKLLWIGVALQVVTLAVGLFCTYVPFVSAVSSYVLVASSLSGALLLGIGAYYISLFAPQQALEKDVLRFEEIGNVWKREVAGADHSARITQEAQRRLGETAKQEVAALGRLEKSVGDLRGIADQAEGAKKEVSDSVQKFQDQLQMLGRFSEQLKRDLNAMQQTASKGVVSQRDLAGKLGQLAVQIQDLAAKGAMVQQESDRSVALLRERVPALQRENEQLYRELQKAREELGVIGRALAEKTDREGAVQAELQRMTQQFGEIAIRQKGLQDSLREKEEQLAALLRSMQEGGAEGKTLELLDKLLAHLKEKDALDRSLEAMKTYESRVLSEHGRLVQEVQAMQEQISRLKRLLEQVDAHPAA